MNVDRRVNTPNGPGTIRYHVPNRDGIIVYLDEPFEGSHGHEYLASQLITLIDYSIPEAIRELPKILREERGQSLKADGTTWLSVLQDKNKFHSDCSDLQNRIFKYKR